MKREVPRVLFCLRKPAKFVTNDRAAGGNGREVLNQVAASETAGGEETLLHFSFLILDSN